MCSAYRKNPEDQTNEEWIADYDQWVAEHPGCGTVPSWEFSTQDKKRGADKEFSDLRNKTGSNPEHLFRYLDHRTTRTGGLAMDFETLDHKLNATKFFNVHLTSKYNKRYPSGNRGQFNPPEGGKFRKFWMQAVCRPPYRWSRVHKEMRSALGGLVFVGKIEHATDSKGCSYIKIIDIWPE